MKKREAPFIWIIRVAHPLLISCIMSTILENAVAAFALYIIDRVIPVTNWRVKVIPRRNPMFHMNEMDDGEGRSRRDLFKIFRIGFLVDIFLFI